MVTFDEAMETADKFIISPGCKSEVHGYFTNNRVDRNTIPECWYAYDIRHGDSGNFCSIEPFVVVNHAGTFLAQQSITMTHGNRRSLSGRGGYTFA